MPRSVAIRNPTMLDAMCAPVRALSDVFQGRAVRSGASRKRDQAT